MIEELTWFQGELEKLYDDIKGNAVLEETCSDVLIKYKVGIISIYKMMMVQANYN